MVAENFKYVIKDYAGAEALLKRIQATLGNVVLTYDAARKLPDQAAPGWSGNTKTHLVSTMERYGTKAKEINATADVLLKAALDFCQTSKNSGEQFNTDFNSI